VEVAETAEEAAVTVRDTGPGISPEDMERIFEPFYRGQAQKSIPGTGLGLPIAKRIAEGHGGRIEVETTPGKGSAFRVVLPREGRTMPGARWQREKEE
jgi:signal transduction histidine kinase